MGLGIVQTLSIGLNSGWNLVKKVACGLFTQERVMMCGFSGLSGRRKEQAGLATPLHLNFH